MYVQQEVRGQKIINFYFYFFNFLIFLGQLHGLYIKFTPSDSINSKNILCWDSSTSNWKIHFFQI
jgi:hypothetical protein